MSTAAEVLECLERTGGGVRAPELAYQLGCSQTAVVKALCDLEAEGLAEPVTWQVTPAGREARRAA